MNPVLPTRHYEKLRAYILAVVGDMITRGKIRRAVGENIDDVIRKEADIVLEEIEGDLLRLGKEMGLSFLNTLAQQGLDLIFGRGKK